MKIGILGLGLIGGSIALAAKNRLNADIAAVSRSIVPLEKAYADGIVNKYSTEDLSIFSDCEIVFICTPVDKITQYCKELGKYTTKDTIITDVGSTKEHICRQMEKMPDINFIGGHPMAGTEFSGYSAAKENMFDNAVYVIAPLKNSKQEHIEKLENFAKGIGARPIIADPVAHDKAVAAVSHIPHIIAYSLSNTASHMNDKYDLVHNLAAGGFKDTTRVASSGAEIWCAICRENKENVLQAGKLFADKMNEALTLLGNDDYEKLSEFFREAKIFRDSFK